ncbi:MAG: hypothetical protein H7123_03995 [Thermoleophilia bacterium]|nr:hypothetical protein [Thermoleophilia bacterium]
MITSLRTIGAMFTITLVAALSGPSSAFADYDGSGFMPINHPWKAPVHADKASTSAHEVMSYDDAGDEWYNRATCKKKTKSKYVCDGHWIDNTNDQSGTITIKFRGKHRVSRFTAKIRGTITDTDCQLVGDSGCTKRYSATYTYRWLCNEPGAKCADPTDEFFDPAPGYYVIVAKS